MDTVTHALAGYVVAKTGLTRDTGRWGVMAGVAASLFPDADGLLRFIYGAEFYLKYHRGLTNSVFLIIPFSLLFAWLFVKISGMRRFWTFFLIWVVELLVHTFLDLLTSYGTMILSPFSNQRFALDWVFIIDLFLTATFLLPIMAMCIWRRRQKALARISVTLAALYIAICAYNHYWSLSLARTHTRENGWMAENIASLPQPFSPFHWGNYLLDEEKIHEGYVNLIGKRERMARSDGNLISRLWARYQPIHKLRYRAWDRFEDSPWVERALSFDEVQTFLWFARFPVARYQAHTNSHHRVTFFDLRFGSIDGRRPFLYEVIFDPRGEVVFQGLHQGLSLKDGKKRSVSGS